MLTTPSAIRSILFIYEDEDDYSIVQEAVQRIEPAIASCCLPCSDYPSFKEEDFLPDLIFMEMDLAEVDSCACLQKIKEGRYANIPVIVYGGSSHHEDIKQAYACGATLYVVKSDTYAQLLACLEQLLKQVSWQNPEEVTRGHQVEGTYIAFEAQ
ncbi:response regulator [Paraflavisolibacter sp. H34]|uniref:response regulator n=1 Tax=Huijunlia imazamoxiresistens TaxID=3127457 RepID=UPI0030193C0E